VTALPSVGNVSNASSSASSSVTTSPQVVRAGSAAYVQVAINVGGVTVDSIIDAQGGVYELLAAGSFSSTGSLWVFRRSSALASSSNFTVTVVSSASGPIQVVAIEVLNDGGVDSVVSAITTGTGTTESSVIGSSVTNDLVLFLGADSAATFSSWGTGQTGISHYPSAVGGIVVWGSYQAQASPGGAASDRYVTASTSWGAVSVAISPQFAWSGVASRPFITVSPIGQISSPPALIPNNGADFGPDTPGTKTNGIQEALNTLGGASGSNPTVGTTSGVSNNSATTVTTPSQSVAARAALYVQVAMYGTGLSTPTVSDSQNGVYNLLIGGTNGSVNLWVFRRTAGLGVSSSFQVTVDAVPASAVPMEVMAIEVLNDDGVDVESTFQSGSSMSESSSLATSVASDLVLFVGADANATFSAWGTGQTGLSGYPTPPTSITAWGSYQSQAAPGTASSTRTVTGSSIAWAGVSIAIRASSPGGTVYCQAGTYVLKAPIGNTGNYQSVIFEPGSTLTGVYASLNPGGNPLEALIWIAQDVVAVKWSSRHAYHHIKWAGNGCQINLLDGTNPLVVSNVFEYTVNGPLCDTMVESPVYGPPAPTSQAHTVEIEGFEVFNLSGNLIWFQTNNVNAEDLHPDVEQQAHNWKISNLSAHDWAQSSSIGYLGRVIGISSVRLFHLDRIIIDLRNAPGDSPGWTPFFVFSARGDTAGIVISNSVTLLSAGMYGWQGVEALELQGSGMNSPYGYQSTARVLIDNCIFLIEPLEGYPEQPIVSAYGNVYIDDNDGAGNSSFITDFEFRNCEFVNVAISLQSSSSYFGFARFNNCRFSFQAPPVGTVSGISSAGASSVATPSQSVLDGGVIYLQVAMRGSGLTTPTVSDNQSGNYELLRSGHKGTIFLWVFARKTPVSGSTSFTVTVTPSSNSSPIEAVAIELLNEAAIDAVGSATTGTASPESGSVSTAVSNDAVIFFGADNSATSTGWGPAQSPIPGYPSPPSGLTAWASYQIQPGPASASSSRSFSGSGIDWVAFCIAVGPAGNFTSGTLSGRGPFYSGGLTTTVPSTTVIDYTNNRGFDEVVIINDSAVTEIDFNGTKTGQTFGAFFLRTGDSLTVKFSTAGNYSYTEVAR
jgi:hypothetical protein